MLKHDLRPTPISDRTFSSCLLLWNRVRHAGLLGSSIKLNLNHGLCCILIYPLFGYWSVHCAYCVNNKRALVLAKAVGSRCLLHISKPRGQILHVIGRLEYHRISRNHQRSLPLALRATDVHVISATTFQRAFCNALFRFLLTPILFVSKSLLCRAFPFTEYGSLGVRTLTVARAVQDRWVHIQSED